MRSFFPLNDDAIVVHAHDDSSVAIVIGLATVKLSNAEAASLAYCLTRAVQAAPPASTEGAP